MSRNAYLSFLLILVASISTALLVNHGHQPVHQAAHLDQQPDMFMTDAEYFEYNKQGDLHSHMTTTKIDHYAHMNSSRFENPTLMTYTDQHTPWHISAKHGKSHYGTKWVYLWNNVIVHKSTEPNNPETTITTPGMTLLPPKTLAKTDQNVTITRPGSIVHSRGMRADLKQGVITLLSHSRGVYEPTQHVTQTNAHHQHRAT